MSKKSTSTSKPAEEFMPYIMGGADAVKDAYGQNSGTIQNVANSVTGLLPSMLDKYRAGDAGINAARGYNTDVLSGKYLDGGNPNLQGVIDSTNNDVRNQSEASLGLKGLAGGSSYADIISRNLARNTGDMRYADYNNERQRMATSAGQSPSIASADALQIAPIMATLDASQAPLQAAGGYAGSLGGLLGGYQTTQSKASPWQYIMQALASGAQAYAGGG